MPRAPTKGYHFTRQASGKIVYKYLDADNVWRTKRVPPHIVFMEDAVDWIRVHLYGGAPSIDTSARHRANRVACLRTLAERTNNPHERAAAQRALAKMGERNATDGGE